jgi:hypothetical protein
MSANGRIKVWTAPIVLGVVSAIGLTTALVSDDIGDVVAWVALAVPVVVVLWYSWPRKRA